MAIKLDSFSRFRETQPIVTDALNGGKIETFGLWKEPSFLTGPLDPQLDVINIKVDGSRAGRPDLIANDVYGSPSYFWVLIAYNKPKDLFGWPRVNSVVLAPNPQLVLGNL
jgi:hypothetical protein